MEKYTQKDFDKFKMIDGIKQCPSGDYSSIGFFGEGCFFGKRCSFGEDCSFGEGCSFGERCFFGKRCSFGEDCSFGERCFFGKRCSFGEDCSFGENIKIEGGHKLISYLGIDRIGSRFGKTYFFKCEDGLFVRCGCWFGTIKDFKQRVKENYSSGRFRKEYDMAIEFAEKWVELK